MRIQRHDMMGALSRFAQSGHGVVIGQPGVGKTYALRQLAHELAQGGAHVIPIAIDEWGIGDLSDLRAVLGVDCDLVEYLRTKSSTMRTQPGFVFLDAFDAVRSELGRKQIRHLIRRLIDELGSVWRVLVSVRVYDAQKSMDLLELFPGAMLENGFTEKGIPCRHFYIPNLRDDERAEAIASIPKLDDVYAAASPEFKELLRTPFNLWLMENILSVWADGQRLGQITSEVGLLQAFWNSRVTRGVNSDAREAVARLAAQAMVHQSSLSVPLGDIYAADTEVPRQELFSAEVLCKVGRNGQRVAFRHNMLFDYAVSRLLIADTPEALASFLKEDKSRPLFLRPSLYYHFASLWQSDLPAFWETYWRMLLDNSGQIRLFAKLLPPLVVARELRGGQQLQPLIQRREKERTRTDEALKRVFQALRVVESETPQRDPAFDEHWVHTVQALASSCSDDLSYELGTWTERALHRTEKAPNEQLRNACGQIARDLFRWIWERRKAAGGTHFDGQGSRLMLPLVTQTYGTDPAASRTLLEPILDLLKEDGFPIDYVYRLADEVPNIWPHDPEFAAQIYRAVFARTESSEVKTNMGTPVLPMSSTRRQDFGMCYYTLKEHYPSFLRACPTLAAKAALHLIEAHVHREYQRDYRDKIEPEPFEFRGGTAHYISDGSGIWAESHHHRDDALEIAGSLFALLKEVAATPEQNEHLDQILDGFRDIARVGFTWSQLLLAGAVHPATLGIRLYELFLARPIRENSDSVYQLGECLKATYPHLTTDQRIRIETLLLEVPDPPADDEGSEYRIYKRNRLLGCIPDNLIALPDTARLIGQLKKTDAVPANEPMARFFSETRSFSMDDFLKEKGADVTKPANIRFREIAEALGGFIAENRNKKTALEDVRALLPQLLDAWKLLGDPGDADAPVLAYLWERVSEAAATAARGCERPDSDEYRLCRTILIRSAEHEDPKPRPEFDAKYNFPHWSHAPRNSAAHGLPWLLVWNDNDSEVIGAIRALAHDQVPSVRYLVVTDVWRLFAHYEKDCFNILDEVAKREQNTVVQDALCSAIGRLVRKYENESVAILAQLYNAIRNGDSETLLHHFVDIVVWLTVERENAWACGLMENFLTEPLKHPRELERAALEVMEHLTPQQTSKAENRPQTDRAKQWLSRAIAVAAESLKQFFASKPDARVEANQKIAHGLYGVIDQVVTRTYFAAGLFKDSKHHPSLNFDDLRRYFREIQPILEEVLRVSDVARGGMIEAPTAHHFMELLNGVLACDPKAVLSMASRVVNASKGGNYQFDSMAVREVVTLVESILADHRIDARDEESLGHLLDLLDTFVEAGWPEALNLVWRLDEIFR